MKRLLSTLWLQSSLDDVQDFFPLLSPMILPLCVVWYSDHINEGERDCNHTYDHVVADVTERGLLEDVLHEAVSCRVYLQRVAWLGAWCRRRSAGDGRRDRRNGEVGGVRRGHPDVAEMARAAAHVGEQLRLVVAACSEEVVRALAADALGLEGQGALESLQLKREKRSWRKMEQGREKDKRLHERIKFRATKWDVN